MPSYDTVNGPAWSRAQHFRRAESFVNVTTVSKQLLGANPNRIGLIMSTPTLGLGSLRTNPQYAQGVDTSVTGVKLTTTVSGVVEATLLSATMLETTGTGVVADLEVTHSAITSKIFRATTAGQFTGQVPLSGNDTVRWNVITAIGASVTDFSLGLMQNNGNNRVTISVNNPAVDTQGIIINADVAPLMLWRDVIGDALTEDLFIVSNGNLGNMGVWDIFY